LRGSSYACASGENQGKEEERDWFGRICHSMQPPKAHLLHFIDLTVMGIVDDRGEG
jgi:hypothetical protein